MDDLLKFLIFSLDPYSDPDPHRLQMLNLDPLINEMNADPIHRMRGSRLELNYVKFGTMNSVYGVPTLRRRGILRRREQPGEPEPPSHPDDHHPSRLLPHYRQAHQEAS